jgi:hypothetical protein
MIRNIIALAFLVGCAGAVDQDLIDDNDVEIGQTELGLSAKFSPTWSFGVSDDTYRHACSVANGGGPHGLVYYKCRIPLTKAITFNFIGSDPFQCPGSGCSNAKSWKEETYLARQDLLAIFSGSGFTMAETALQPATLTITTGTCPGDAMTSDNIQTYVCTSWGGTDSSLSESLTGTYYGWSTGMVIKVDTAKIQTRSTIGSDASCATAAVNYHQLLEHGMYAAVAQAMGLGTINRSGLSQVPWNEDHVATDDDGQGCFDMHQIVVGDACRVKSYVSTSQTSFSQTTGSCTD